MLYFDAAAAVHVLCNRVMIVNSHVLSRKKFLHVFISSLKFYRLLNCMLWGCHDIVYSLNSYYYNVVSFFQLQVVSHSHPSSPT